MSKKVPEEFYYHLGKSLTKARNLRGLSQADVAGHLGLTFQQVQKYENGVNRIPIHHIVTFSKITGVPLNELVDLEYGSVGIQISNRHTLILMQKMYEMTEDELKFLGTVMTQIMRMNDKKSES